MWPSARSRPHSPATAAGTATTSSSPSAAMPRISFTSRPTSPSNPSHATPEPLFTSEVWLPSEPSFFTFGFGSKWSRTHLALWMTPVVDDASAMPLLHLQLGDRASVVVTALHRQLAVANGYEDPQGKKEIHVDVKVPAEVRRAVLYHTAAAATPLVFYVDTDAERDHLVAVIQHALGSTSLSPPHIVRPPSPPMATPTPETSMDTAFAQLEIARAKQERGHVVDALAAYSTADQAFASVDAHVKMNGGDVVAGGSALRTRLHQARCEIRAAVEALEMERALPRAAVAVTTTTVDVSEPTVDTERTPSHPSPATTLDARLVDLQAFGHTRDVDRAQRERRVAADDLTLRLHALRNEKPSAASMVSLQERLERLRGGSASPPSEATAARPSGTTALSPVDQIIQQAMDEVALGIVDDDEDHENTVDGDASDDDDSGDSTSSSSCSSSGSDTSSDRRRRRPGGRQARP